jgi:hypothetical protein
MSDSYRVVRRSTAIVLFLALVAGASTAAAQYMYLDANGDGIHTPADVFPTSGTVTFDVWLKTNENRDGSTPVCSRNPDSPFTINSYTFLLLVRNGTVAWGGSVNRMPDLTIWLMPDSSSTEYYAGWASGTIHPPGTYRLASVTATIASGMPSVSIAANPAGISGSAITSFGCNCEAVDYDNTMKLGIDWFDVEGLPYAVAGTQTPDLIQPAPMTVAEGQTAEQTLHATDSDGQPLAFSAHAPPAFMSVTTADPGSGSATGLVRLNPGFADAGTVSTLIVVSDGISEDEAILRTTVTNVNRAPVLDQPADMMVAGGSFVQQTIHVSDPDGGLPGLTKREGPPFMDVVRNGEGAWGDVTGLIRLSPSYNDVGTYVAVVEANDGFTTDQKSLQIVVTEGNRPPQTADNLDVTVPAGTFRSVALVATDPEGDPLSFALSYGPPFVTVGTVDPGNGTGTGRVDLQPLGRDAGDHLASVTVSDGHSTVFTSISIHVLREEATGDMSLVMSGEPGDPIAGGETIRRGPIDGTFRVFHTQSGGVHLTFESHPAGLPDFELAPRSVPRPTCLSAPAEAWSFEFQPPVGASLGVGAYLDAGRTPTAGNPGLHVAPYCGNCSTVSGGFEIKQLEITTSGEIGAFRATFEQRCNGSASVLRGEVRYNASVPVRIIASTHLLVGVGDGVSFPVMASSDSGGATLTADLPAGARITPYSNLYWQPTFEQVGTHRLIFHATGARGDTASTFCDVTVRARNAVTATVNANQLELLTSNRGTLAYDLRDHSAGLFYPAPTEAAVSSIGGLWLGAMVGGVPRVALGGDPSEFVPGPMSSGEPLPFDPRFKNYRLNRGASGMDRQLWPRGQGAPIDTFGNPLDAGDVTVWSVYNDADPEAHAAPASRSDPLGAEVRQLSWSIQHTGALERTVFLKFAVRNAGRLPWENAYAAVWLDPTVFQYQGHVAVVFNDRVGCDTTRALGYTYSTRGPYGDGGAPPALGVTLLKGPIVPNPEGGYRELGMSAFRRFTAPPFRTDLGYAGAAYRVLQGLQEDGSPVHEFDDPSKPMTRWEVSGDPVAGSGWIDSDGAGYATRRFLLSTGPFEMGPGDEQVVEVAIVVGRGTDALASITELRNSVDQVRGGIGAQPNRPPSVSVSRPYGGPYPAYEGVGFSLQVYAWDADGDRVSLRASSLPRGATFTDRGGGRGDMGWVPDFDQAGVHFAEFVATDAVGAAASDTISITVLNLNREPIARSGGPYYGAAGTAVEFNGSATSDPDGDPVLTTWSFGDGNSAPGPTATHTYASPGTYEVVLLAYDQTRADHDTTTATIAAPIEARTFVSGGNGLLQLASPAPTVTLSLEIEGGGVALSELQPASFLLGSQGTGTISSINAVDAETRVGGDQDGNGVPELSLVFRKQDLRALFGNLPEGRTTASAILTGVAAKGVILATSVELTIETTHKPLAVILAPNPINPEGMLTFTTTRPGPAQVTLYDVRGRLVRKLFESSAAPAGYHDVRIDGRDSGGHPLPTGLYFYRVQASEGSVSGRITILK